MSDGKCPSCQNNINKPPKSSEEFKKVTINNTQILPNICTVCAETTNKTKTITASKNMDSTNSSTALASFVLFSWFGLLVSGIFGGNKQSFKIKLPVCKRCNQDDKTNPKFINFDVRSIDIVAHKNFIAHIKQN